MARRKEERAITPETPEQICQKHCLVDPYGAADPIVLEAMKEYAWQEIRELKKALRKAFEDYTTSEGCSCCETLAHPEHRRRLEALLSANKPSKYKTKRKLTNYGNQTRF